MKNAPKLMIAFASGQALQIMIHLLLDAIGVGSMSFALSTVFGLIFSLAMVIGSVMTVGIDYFIEKKKPVAKTAQKKTPHVGKVNAATFQREEEQMAWQR